MEFNAAADAGKAVLVGQAGGIKYGEEHTLSVTAMDDVTADVPMQVASPPASQTSAPAQSLAFVPRASRGGRGRARGRAFGIGFSQTATHQSSTEQTTSASATQGGGDDMEVEPPTASAEGGDNAKLSGQDRFRAMLQQSRQG